MYYISYRIAKLFSLYYVTSAVMYACRYVDVKIKSRIHLLMYVCMYVCIYGTMEM